MGRKARKLSQDYLERAAFHYLGRFASSRANLVRVLTNKVRRRHGDLSPPSNEEQAWIEAAAEKCARLGLIDDVRYAKDRAASLHRAGRSLRRIRQYLASKGVGADVIAEALEFLVVDGHDPDLEAALAYARKRLLGPFAALRGRPPASDEPRDRRQKEMGAFARAGFPFQVAARILDCPDIEAAEALLDSD